MRRSRFPVAVTAAVLAFFYLPIVVLVANSFNPARFSSRWQGFSLVWYRRLFESPEVWQALRNTLIVAVAVTAISVVLGTLAAFALHRYAASRLQRVHYTLIYAPLVVPEILMGIGLLMFFVAAGVPLGLGTIILAHVTFCVSFVAMTVLARLQDFDFSVVEAARDLGAGWGRIVRRVLVPMLMP
ncbi:MAG: ABC transporter permease subunit, partial [Candidatus Aminicenantes bacterium]